MDSKKSAAYWADRSHYTSSAHDMTIAQSLSDLYEKMGRIESNPVTKAVLWLSSFRLKVYRQQP